MSVNSSSSSNASLPPSPSSSTIHSLLQYCFNFTTAAFSTTANTIISILILVPLYIFVLYLGLQRWRQQRSGQTMSHSDVFTFHMVVIELLSVFGSTLIFCAVHVDLPLMTMVGSSFFSINLSGQMLFHILTCVERYLAVVHPITYLSLRKANGIRLRNVTIGCVWLLCFASTGFMPVSDYGTMTIVLICIMAFVVIGITFCSLSVLCVLIRPGPGEGSGGKKQSKLKAFYTIMAILVVLLVRFGGNMVTIGLYALPLLGENEKCALSLSVVWFYLPSSLALPLLFLQRAGKLLSCKNNSKTGQGSD